MLKIVLAICLFSTIFAVPLHRKRSTADQEKANMIKAGISASAAGKLIGLEQEFEHNFPNKQVNVGRNRQFVDEFKKKSVKVMDEMSDDDKDAYQSYMAKRGFIADN